MAEDRVRGKLIFALSDYEKPGASFYVDVDVAGVANSNTAPIYNDRTVTIAKNRPSGSLIATMTATDPDPGQTRTYSIVSGNTNAAFAIHPTTGRVTVANSAALNFESQQTWTLTLLATDNGAPRLSDSAVLTIHLTDINDAPVITPVSFSVAENSAAGTLVGTVSASDADVGQSVTFSLASPLGGLFAIDPTTGRITVTGPLNHERQPNLTLVVRATDNATVPRTTEAAVTVTVTDVNDAPVLNDRMVLLAENRVLGSRVATLRARDEDLSQLQSYSILSGNESGAFAIDSVTGILTVANPALFDFETRAGFQLVVRSTDDAPGASVLSDDAVLTIQLTDVNGRPKLADRVVSVAENSPAGTLVATLLATVPDAGQSLIYTIVSGNRKGAFAIDPVTGKLTVSQPMALDYERVKTFRLRVRATDSGFKALSDTAIVKVNLTNVVEAPVLNDQTFSLADHSPLYTLIGTARAGWPRHRFGCLGDAGTRGTR